MGDSDHNSGSRQINFRVSTSEYSRLEERAQEAGMTLPQYARFRTVTEAPVAFVAVANVQEHLTGLENAINQARQHLSGDTLSKGDS